VKISQRHFTAVFEKHQDDRKKLFAAAQRAFSKMCPLAGSGAFFVAAPSQDLLKSTALCHSATQVTSFNKTLG
jgi:hypothetical protein